MDSQPAGEWPEAAETEKLAPLAPGSTIGIFGGGQLGRMLALAAAPLGLKCHIFCPDEASPAFDVAATKTVAAYDDRQAQQNFAAAIDVATYEFENIDVAAIDAVSALVPVRPGGRSLTVSQDRLTEKTYLTGAGVPVTPFVAVEGRDDLERAIAELGTPLVLKTRRFGYDGKGQVIVGGEAEVPAALAAIDGAPAIAEQFVAFEREISVIAVRGVSGDAVTYDVSDNVHRDHILHTSSVPALISPEVASAAQQIALTIADSLGHVGALGVEFFVAAGGHLIVNEIAPRVHNSGHWTLDACPVSQFENHIRAVAGWPLMPADRYCDAVMTNLIGDEFNHWQTFAGQANIRFQAYGKADVRAGRKMGHVTRLLPRSVS